MKTLYLIRHAKSDWSSFSLSDVERGLSKKGYRDVNTIGSYLSLRGVTPEVILSSCALRTQETADELAKKIEFTGEKYYLKELYLTSPEAIKEIVMIQDDDIEVMFVIGHNPQLSELCNMLIDEHIAKIPTLGVVAINFNVDRWEELDETKGQVDFFIYPKQFKYYMPKQIRTTLG
ncbi:MAG: histidine phosphatase family protein [Campylobacterota bacterium]|nr:histidine phosphatase family protein [Campylobacterota bacterium]